MIGQALVAASRTVEESRHAHSLHGYFLRAGDTSIPILYKVDRIRDGKSFTTRRVAAIHRAGSGHPGKPTAASRSRGRSTRGRGRG